MKAKWIVLLSALLAIAASLAVTGSAHTAGASAAALAKPAVPATGAFVGAYVDVTGSIDREPDVASFETSTNRALAIDNHYELWPADALNASASTPITPLIGEDQLEDAAYGRIPMISWRCPASASDGGGDAAIISGNYDYYINQEAHAVAAYGHPVYIRWFWEMDLNLEGNQRCLGAPGSEGYVRAWQHIWQLFQNAGATNAAFVWNPSSSYAGSSATQFYPGDKYVDWIAADGYAGVAGASTVPKTFASVFANWYSQWAGRKPLMIGETGVGTLPNPQAPGGANYPPGTSAATFSAQQTAWISGMFAALPSEFPDIHAVVYFDTLNPRNDYVLSSQALANFGTLADAPYFQQYGTKIPISFTGTTSARGTTGSDVKLTVTASGFPVPRLTATLPSGCNLVTATAPGTNVKNITGVGTYTCNNACPSSEASTIVAASYYGSQATALPVQQRSEGVSLSLTGTPVQIANPVLTTNTTQDSVSQLVGICSLKDASLSLSDSLTRQSLPAGLSFTQNPYVASTSATTGTVTYAAKSLVAGNTVLYLRAKISGGASKVVCAHSPGTKAPAPTYYCEVPLRVLSPGTVTTTDAVAATLGTDFTYTVKTDGNPTNSIFVIGAMPKWMHFVTYGNGTAEIFGIPTSVNVFTVKFATKGFTAPGSSHTTGPTTTYNLIVTVNP